MVVRLLHIPEDSLYHSEPPPSMFGNDENEDSPTWTNPNWLKSRFHFSFAEYHDPSNDHFGVLRVMNDDLVQPLRGFGMHPHRDMEIVTYILEGHLTHQDSMNRGMAQKIGRGSVQFMTAGTGVRETRACGEREVFTQQVRDGAAVSTRTAEHKHAQFYHTSGPF